MPRCRILRLYPLRTLGMNPRNESADRTLVPRSTVSRWNTLTTWIPMLTPIHPISRGGSTLASVETSDADPNFHWKTP